jgi:hypothetical protein
MIFLHSSARRASSQIISALSQWFKAAFASRCAQVWLWYTSHAESYTPSREQAKRELGLSDWILTRCLRALERLGLAALDLTRQKGKAGCWKVFKRPVFTPVSTPVLPPNFCPPNDPFLPPNNCPPLGKQEESKVKNTNPTPKPAKPDPVYTEPKQGGGDIDRFVDAYPKDFEGSENHRRFAKQHLRNIQKNMQPNEFDQFLGDLYADIQYRLKNCHYWRAENYRPNVARYVAEELWQTAICPKTHSKPHTAPSRSVRDLSLADELNDRSWAT